MIDQPEAILEQLVGYPLTKTTRNGYTQYFHFGKAQVQNNSGLVLDVGAFTLAVQCHWHLLQQGRTLTTYNEVFLPKSAETAKFDWKVPGNNLRDKKLMELINTAEEKQLEVKKVKLMPGFGLEVTFANNMLLQLLPQKSASDQPDQLWSLFSNTDPAIAIEADTSGVKTAAQIK
ncbi:MAG: hypothetical protein LPJ89_09510 [Hymenobacteraceae bacterium]|nr:hypothetical protein [Hymenobacteraceae bacterium]MDX5394961.1 hypothetical protein [Hymenobacteraceae bacterium]MDX5444002.1 hypothetical protein [Hymenobacteraceae bacterium]MDX5510995.1 hypothetical protein [Hymenobacteraceae bacterium]